jgi:hypothetical protein
MRIFVILLMIVIIILLIGSSPEGKYYDCRDAHWHPDYPIEVKQECARLRMEEWRRLNQEPEAKDRYI